MPLIEMVKVKLRLPTRNDTAYQATASSAHTEKHLEIRGTRDVGQYSRFVDCSGETNGNEKSQFLPNANNFKGGRTNGLSKYLENNTMRRELPNTTEVYLQGNGFRGKIRQTTRGDVTSGRSDTADGSTRLKLAQDSNVTDLQWTCPVCLSRFDEVLAPAEQSVAKQPAPFIKTSSGCEHKICEACMRSWILEQAKQRKLPVRCPVCRAGCVDKTSITHALSAEEMDTYLSVELLVDEGHTKLEDSEIDAILRNDMEIFGFVACPGCGMAIQKEGTSDDVKCRCGVHFCYMCGEGLGKGFVWRLLAHQCSCKGRFRTGRRPVFFA